MAAAEDKGIEFIAYGGTSVGALVGLLASVGFTGQDLKAVLIDLDLRSLLDDGGRSLARLQQLYGFVASRFSPSKALRAVRALPPLLRLYHNLGLYEGKKVEGFLIERVSERVPLVKERHDFSFADLVGAEMKCKPLKVIASDLVGGHPVIFGPEGPRKDFSVIKAVRASASYPFLFRPIEDDTRWLLDGGLSSNLPAFLFVEEYRRQKYFTLAFDLIETGLGTASDDYAMFPFILDMINTAITAGDELIRTVSDGVLHVPVPLRMKVSPINFNLTREVRQGLYDSGYAATAETLEKWEPFKNTRHAGAEVKKQLMARYGDPKLFQPVLAALARDVESNSRAERVRTHITLPTGRDTRMVTYHYNMEMDADSDLELKMSAGCSGRAWDDEMPVVADLEAAAKNPQAWGMTVADHAKVPRDRKAMLSVPIFARSQGETQENGQDAPVVGILSVDSTTMLSSSGWVNGNTIDSKLVEIVTNWAYTLSRIF